MKNDGAKIAPSFYVPYCVNVVSKVNQIHIRALENDLF